jgi:hypothetical protein
MVVLLDEQFLVHSAVHKAVLRLLRNCVGDDLQEQLDGKNKVMGAAGSAVRGQPSEYEEDCKSCRPQCHHILMLYIVVNLLCILCSRIRTYRELLMIFFHDKHWYHSEPLFSVEEEEDEDEDEDEEKAKEERSEKESTNAEGQAITDTLKPNRPSSPAPSQATVTSAPVSSLAKKPEYEFLLFNYLLRFVHREGHIGDFARAGLLFLIDVAMSSGEPSHRSGGDTNISSDNDPINDAALALAEYILDGDFSEVLGAGLGAVYSLLPSKLEFSPPAALEGGQGVAMTIGTVLDTDEIEKQEILRQRRRSMGIEDASNPDFKSRLDHFLKLLEFLQDVLRRNVVRDLEDSTLDASTLIGSAIVQSILDAVRQIFLENVLYPSILECSDNDGSAVAVMSYIEIMIRTLQGGPLSDLLVDFLVSEDNDEVRPRQRPHSMLMLGGNPPPRSGSSDATEKQNKLRRRKSSAMLLLEMEAPETRRPSEYFTSMGRFTLKDLLMSNLRSNSLPTATAALQLFQSLLLRHPQLTVNRLLIVLPDPKATSFPAPLLTSLRANETRPSADGDDDDDEVFIYPGAENDSTNADTMLPPSSAPMFSQPETTYSTHEREMGLYLTLVSRVDPSHSSDNFSTGYDHYLRDALYAIYNQRSFKSDLDADSRAHLKHRLNVNDPILSLILEYLRKFFYNTPEFNIALTGVLAILAIDPDRSLAGWLTFASNDATPRHGMDSGAKDNYTDDGDDRSIDYEIEEKLVTDSNRLPASSMDEQSQPVVHSIFQGLVAQLERYRQVVNKFDKFLLERRQGLLFSENLSDALTLALELADDKTFTLTPEASAYRPKQKSKSSLVSFLTPKKSRAKATPIPSEPATPPRGVNKNIAASPFGFHYEQTGAIVVEPFVAPIPPSSPWTPAKSMKWNADEEDVFTSSNQWGEQKASIGRLENDDVRLEKARVTLSHLLDNVVILEESIKELVAIIQARRSLGIDSIRYL